jgi:hypothetical protein
MLFVAGSLLLTRIAFGPPSGWRGIISDMCKPD